MRGIFWLIVLVAFGIGVWMIADMVAVVPQRKLCFIDRGCVWVKVAKTEKEQARGLSRKWFMPENVGMLFVYEEAQFLSFWMKEMRFGLDFVWIRDNEVVDITENVGRPRSIEAERTMVAPRVSTDSVLELNAGWVKRNELAIGDIVRVDE